MAVSVEDVYDLFSKDADRGVQSAGSNSSRQLFPAKFFLVYKGWWGAVLMSGLFVCGAGGMRGEAVL